jgi:TolB-like protein/class 3 adenylate cyclase
LATGRVERRLAAILAADVAGYSRLMGVDEEETLARLKGLRRELADPKIKENRGRIVKTTGDGLLIEFASVVDAVRCAVEVQREMAVRNADVPRDHRIEFRMGINLGDIIKDGRDIYGDGVNVAARLEALAEPGGICVSRVVRDQVRDKVDFSFEDMGDRQVKNIARPVRVHRIVLADDPVNPPDRTTAPLLPLPQKPSIAVLPFENMSGDREQEYFADGVVEDIITALSRLAWLFVIARNSSFTYKGKSVDMKQVGRELGVRYLLEGSVRKAGSRVRITGQLIDTTTGAHVWADRIDGELEDIFELQDQVTSKVVGAIEPKLRLSEIARAARKPTDNLDAYDLFLRALAEGHKMTLEGNRQAIRLLQRALAIDPSYAPAAGLAGWSYSMQRVQGWSPLTDVEITEGIRLAKQAIETGQDDPDALWMAGITLWLMAGEFATAASVIDRALALNSNSAQAYMASGWVLSILNRPHPAIESLHRALRLSPLDPLGYMFKAALAFAHTVAGRYEEAMEWADQSLREQERFVPSIRYRAALCGHLGRVEEGREWLRRLLDVRPGLTVAMYLREASTYQPPEIRAIFADGFRRIGLPEG